ncbi:MAG: polysaccharide deacetylase family protein [Clostridia bacterium]
MLKKMSFYVTFLIVLTIVLSVGIWWSQAQQAVRTIPSGETASKLTQSSELEKTVPMEQSGPPKVELLPQSVKKQKWYDNQVVVLMYHHVSDKTDRRYEISPSEFKAHLDFLYQNDFHPISLSEFLRFIDTGVLMTDNAVLITFDDGYESYYTQAFPLLKQYQFPSVNFLIASRLRDSIERKRENMTTPLSDLQVKELLASGLADIGSHTYSLHEQREKNEWGELAPETAPVYLEDLSRLEEEGEYRNRLYVDFMMSRAALSQVAEKEIKVISFPFGFTNDIVTETAEQAGYKYAFNSKPAVVKQGTNPLAIPRFDVGLHEVDTAHLLELFTRVKTNF